MRPRQQALPELLLKEPVAAALALQALVAAAAAAAGGKMNGFTAASGCAACATDIAWLLSKEAPCHGTCSIQADY
jgi:hypothetical protein